MKKYILIVSFFFSQLYYFSQTEASKKLVNEGIELHDKGEYEKAVKKYDEAIAGEPDYMNAYYEKAYTFYAMKKYDECIDLSKDIIKKFPDDPALKGVYVHYGSALDDVGKGDEAIKVYNQGLKKFPGYFLLHFNKAVTYSIMDKPEKAYDCYLDALRSNPLHASSYYRVAEMLKNKNHIPAIMACIMHLVLEPDSDRSVTSFTILKELMYGSVKKTGDNSTSILLDADMLDTKNKNKNDNFSMQEMMYNLSSALDKDSVLAPGNKTEIEKFDLKLKLLISSLLTPGKGFFSERYVPFFKKLVENNYTLLVSRLVFANTNDDRNLTWLRVNTDQSTNFYNWLKVYKWPEQ